MFFKQKAKQKIQLCHRNRLARVSKVTDFDHLDNKNKKQKKKNNNVTITLWTKVK